MGKLIVLEGTDGTGKSTQFGLLLERMEREGMALRHVRFPRYDQPSSALIRMYLGGEFGSDPDAVNAYAASTFYAVDRYASYVQDWGVAYQAGTVILCDRYTTSNAVHQGGKVPPQERQAFFQWLYDLEFRRMGLPQPDLVLLLDMPTALSEQLMRRREAATHTKADIHEADSVYLAHCRETAREAADYYGWTVISCARDGKLRTKEDIHTEIFDQVLKSISL